MNPKELEKTVAEAVSAALNQPVGHYLVRSKQTSYMRNFLIAAWSLIKYLFNVTVTDTLKMAAKPTEIALRVAFLAAMLYGAGHVSYYKAWPKIQDVWQSMPTLVWPDNAEEPKGGLGV